MIIAIDGPSGTGKTTIAKMVAKRLGYNYFDTGAMYRALTVCALKMGITPEDEKQMNALLKNFHFDIQRGDHYFANGEDVTVAIRTPEITERVSAIAALPKVRETLVRIQREFGAAHHAVYEGRDIGTVVFPNAECKIFLTASPAVRAKRRYLELKDKYVGMSEHEVMLAIQTRDHLDSTRAVAPLKQAEDAHLIDTSDLTIDEVVEEVLKCITES